MAQNTEILQYLHYNPGASRAEIGPVCELLEGI